MASLRRSALDEPIRVTGKQHGYFPTSFTWRGRRHAVEAVEQCWTVSRRHWRRHAQRHCFRVRTAEAVYVLYEDLLRDSWYLERVLKRT